MAPPFIRFPNRLLRFSSLMRRDRENTMIKIKNQTRRISEEWEKPEKFVFLQSL